LNVTVIEALPVDFQKFKETVRSLARLLLQRRLFPSTHPSAEKALSEAFIRMDTLLNGKSVVTLKIFGDKIYFLNFEIDILETKDNAVYLFREALKKLSVGEIILNAGVTKKELSLFIETIENLSKQGAMGDSADIWSGIEHIKIRGAQQSVEKDVQNEVTVNSRSSASADRERKDSEWEQGDSNMREFVFDILQRVEKLHSLDEKTASRKVLQIFENFGKNTPIVLLLRSLRDYDSYTFYHSVNVAVISTAIGRKLELDEDEVDAIGLSALLHDIGKLYVPKDILFKGGRLSPAEWIVVKRHPIDGEKILREERIGGISRAVAYEHHMRYDMKGYPVPKPGYEMERASHIVRIADTYDALTTKRPYRKQLNPYEAIKVMEKAKGGEFHPEYLDLFMRVLGNIPIGSVLQLESGETVVVVDTDRPGGDLPRVRVIKDEFAREVRTEIILDLNEIDPKTATYKRRIIDVKDSAIRDIDVGKYIVDKR
jgi:HD-GYP domain-containing protein (c-di-GMP phosphodiesterase class II)